MLKKTEWSTRNTFCWSQCSDSRGETLTCAAGVLDLSQVRGAVEVGEGERGQVFILSDGRRVDVDGRLPAAVAEVSSDSRPLSVIYGNESIDESINESMPTM